MPPHKLDTHKLGIISDTHGFLTETERAVQIFRNQGVQTVIHCGDIVGTSIVQAFQGIETHFVLGNMDGSDVEELRMTIEQSGNRIHDWHLHDWFGSIELSGKRIAFMHGNDTDRLHTELSSGNWDLLCCGHTHVAALEMHGETLLLNPGAFKHGIVVCHNFQPTIAVVTLPELNVERFNV